MIAIVESHADTASTHICERLRAIAEWERHEDDDRPDSEGGGTYYRTDGATIRSFDDLHLELDAPAAAFDDPAPDLLVFASRHSGATGPLLTGHFTGNFGPAEFGGTDRALAEAAPNALSALLEAFDEHAPADYDVGLECTHHGPSRVGCPSLFAELGSEEAQWADPEGAEAVARAILDLRGAVVRGERAVAGFGGGHYAPRFERIARETPWNVGHIAADWAIEEMGLPGSNRPVIERALEASGADHAVVEGDRPALESVLEGLGARVVSERWLRAVGDRPLDLVARVEGALGPIDEGVRFGDARGDPSVSALPIELIGAAEAVDPDRVRTLLESNAVAFETAEGATRIGERAALPAGAKVAGCEELLEGLLDVLAERYDEVTLDREAGAVRATETAFDPDRARELGVPEGPAFGRLSGGETVEIDGEEVDPEAVSRERVERFSLPERWT